MKILLQHPRSLQYVQTIDTWTKSATEAHDFFHTQKAIDFAREYNLSDVYVTVKFPGGDPDVSVLLSAQSLTPDSRIRL